MGMGTSESTLSDMPFEWSSSCLNNSRDRKRLTHLVEESPGCLQYFAADRGLY